MPRKAIPAEAILDLRRRLATLPSRSPERRRLIQESSSLYGVTESTLYRALREGERSEAVGLRLAARDAQRPYGALLRGSGRPETENV